MKSNSSNWPAETPASVEGDGVESPWAKYLKDGESVTECIERNRSDTDAVLSLLVKEKQRTALLRDALLAIEADPFGCPTCHSGTIITAGKEHWERCGYLKMQHALASLLADPRQQTAPPTQEGNS